MGFVYDLKIYVWNRV